MEDEKLNQDDVFMGYPDEEDITITTSSFVGNPQVYGSIYKAGMDDVVEKLRMFGEAVCMILDVLPSDQFSFMVNVSDECKLEFTVRKA